MDVRSPWRTPWGRGRTRFRARLAVTATAATLLAAATGALPVDALPAQDSPLNSPPNTLPNRPPTLYFEHLTHRDGLSQLTVHTLAQDRLGFLWIGTANGLNRFDGVTFKVFRHRPDDPASLSSDSIWALHEDRAGNLWIATKGGGLNRFDPATERFTRFRHDPADPDSLAHDQLSAVIEDRHGTLWIGTDVGLDRLELTDRRAQTRGSTPHRTDERGAEPTVQARFVHYRHDPGDPASLPPGRVLALREDRAGSVWVGTENGLVRLDRTPDPDAAPPGGLTLTTFRHHPDDPDSLGHRSVLALFEDRDGTLWVGTGNGLDRLELAPDRPDGVRFVHYRFAVRDANGLHKNYVNALAEDHDGNLWIGSDDGLNRLDRGAVHAGSAGPQGDGGGDALVSYEHDPRDPHSLSHNRIETLLVDRAGSLWLGTPNGGLSRTEPHRPRFRHFQHDPDDPASLHDDSVRALATSRTGALWVGTYNGLERYAGGRFHRFLRDPDDPASLGHDYVRALHEDRAGTLWIGTWTGLDRYDAATESFVHYDHDPGDPHSLSHHVVLTLAEDPAGNLWVGTRDAGLNRLDPATGRFTRFRSRAGDPRTLTSDRVWSLRFDRAGALWVGTWGGGLNRFDPTTGQVTRTFRSDPFDPQTLSHDVVLSILEDRRGLLWLGTATGLSRLDPASGRCDRFTTADGLANDFVYGVLEDDLGRLWISTNGGITRFDPARGRWTSYDVRDGLQDVEFNAGAYHRGRDGTLYFGGPNGFNSFRPEDFQDSSLPPPVVVTSLKVFEHDSGLDRGLPYAEAVELSHRDNFFSVEYTALSFVRPDKSRFAYRLEGLDPGWVEAGNRRRASYTDVAPGRYLFRVRGSDGDGQWNEEGAALRIVITPPPWRTWWAYLVYVVAASAAIFGFVRSQSRKVAREQAISQRLREIDVLKDQMLAERTAELAERGQLIEERGRLIEDLRAKNEELTRFNYTVSHDLKNPLVTINNFLGLLRKDLAAGDTVRLEHDLARIEAAATKMHRLLEELLELSRIGRVINPPETVDLGELAHEAVELLAGALTARGVEVAIAPDLPVVRGDRTRLFEVFQNLLENAVKFMGDQPAPRIEVGVRRAAGKGEDGEGEDGEGEGVTTDVTADLIFVRDNGIGIEPPYQDRVFGLFERLDQSIDGTGLGLALVKRIVEVHGGAVWVESEGSGRGSTFCFTLPAAAEARLPPGAEDRL